MQFIQIAYCCIAPFLLIIAKLHYEKKSKRFGDNLLATANCLLIFYSIALTQHLLGLYHVATQAAAIFGESGPSAPESLHGYLAREIALILLPFLFLIKKLRVNILLTIVVLVLMYWNNPPEVWNRYDIEIKILSYFSLFCSGYAMLWLLNMLPHQTSPE